MLVGCLAMLHWSTLSMSHTHNNTNTLGSHIGVTQYWSLSPTVTAHTILSNGLRSHTTNQMSSQQVGRVRWKVRWGGWGEVGGGGVGRVCGCAVCSSARAHQAVVFFHRPLPVPWVVSMNCPKEYIVGIEAVVIRGKQSLKTSQPSTGVRDEVWGSRTGRLVLSYSENHRGGEQWQQ